MPTPVFCLYILLVSVFQIISAAASHWTVEFLPGFPGRLPFELETGYVGVGDLEEVQLFYYFVKSEGNPKTDPLLFWLTGGPGCSALTALAFEVGPINFKIKEYDGSLPEVILNPYSWTKKSSILFVDLPVGTGFSYGTTPQSIKTGDFSQVHHSVQFLKKWLIRHPEFLSNPFYVGGDSYSGIVIPVIAQEILEGGYILGNPVTVGTTYQNFAIPFAHRMTLIPDELFESLTSSCKGEYVNIDPSNVDCLRHYNTYQKCISKIHKANILLPKCSFHSPKRQEDAIFDGRSLYNTPKVLLDPEPSIPSLDCPAYKFLLSSYWANNDQVRKALHIRKGSIGEWTRCSDGQNYNYDIENAFPYHVNLSSKGYRSLIYSGDHDMVVSHLDTQAWIKSLNYSIVEDWRPWFIADQVAGYTRSYANNMTFATIKGGGHTAEYTLKECSVIFSRWIARESL
ncbi:serine carboxypeptidase-like 13 [Cucumis melo var. makuwa]|uniref:Serine carboxypeptidase-like 13 n=1 Tax=Cucumis melo var. makuwa TaxID=1194695 RepID=A0A5D3D995_CUCMM|nr:serine carboxypeptidase-like 13 [Cucumis melo var. makuwa]TYK20131.1 serine carboxypeptidase-like 13 [Cucumis melo var. makuwa]